MADEDPYPGAPASEEEVASADTAPAPEEPAAPKGPFDVSLSTAQIQEVWRAPTTDEGLKLIARCLALNEDMVEEDLRTQIWLDMVHRVLDFSRTSRLAPSKARAFLGIENTHADQVAYNRRRAGAKASRLKQYLAKAGVCQTVMNSAQPAMSSIVDQALGMAKAAAAKQEQGELPAARAPRADALANSVSACASCG